MNSLLCAAFLLLTSCASAPNHDSDSHRSLAEATNSSEPIDLTQLKVHEVNELETRMINDVLRAGKLGQFEAQVKIVDPINDPYGALEAALKPIIGMLEFTGAYKPAVTQFVPREVNYYTKKGHALVTSCYVYLYQAKPLTIYAVINSRQCNLTWPGIDQLEGGNTISQFFSGVVRLDGQLKVNDARFVAGEQLSPERIKELLSRGM